MSSKKIILAILVAVVAVGAIFFVLPDNKSSENKTENSNSSDTSVSAPNNDQEFSAAQVAAHDNKADCWTIINGGVYNLTSFITEHPGGDEILRACGKDASTLFNQRQTSSGEEVGSGTPHSSSARSELEQLQIGRLAE